MRNDRSHDVLILPLGLPGALTIPGNARGLVAFAHGSGSSRFSPRNTAVATALNDRRFAALLFDLLTPQEEDDRSNVFNVLMLGDRLVAAVNWLQSQDRRSLTFLSDCSAPVPELRPPSSRQPNCLIELPPWSHAADVRIWRARPSPCSDANSVDRGRRRYRRHRAQRRCARPPSRAEGT